MDRDCVTQFGLQAGMTYSSLAAAGRKKVQKFAELAYEAGVAAERERCRSAIIRQIPPEERFDDQRAAGNTCRAILRDCEA